MSKKEWEDEPDFLEYEDRGYKCKIRRHSEAKHLCGYVVLKKSHPLFGRKYEDIGLEVHGGLTFAGYNSDEEYMIGFDCAHLGDISPGIISIPLIDETYRNIEYVKTELKGLVDQLEYEIEKRSGNERGC